MDWWVLELIWFVGMVFLALWLGPFIRRFGKSYAADVHATVSRVLTGYAQGWANMYQEACEATGSISWTLASVSGAFHQLWNLTRTPG